MVIDSHLRPRPIATRWAALLATLLGVLSLGCAPSPALETTPDPRSLTFTRVLRWNPEKGGTQVMVQGKPMRAINTESLTLAAMSVEAGRVTTMYLGVKPVDGVTVDLFPDSARLLAQADTRVDTLPYLRPSRVKEIVSSMSWGEVLALSLASAAEGYANGARTGTATVYGADGSTSTVVYSDPGPAGAPNATKTAQDRAAQLDQAAARELQGTLLANTVSGPNSVGGFVHFARIPRGTRSLVLEVVVSGVLYSTPLPVPTQP